MTTPLMDAENVSVITSRVVDEDATLATYHETSTVITTTTTTTTTTTASTVDITETSETLTVRPNVPALSIPAGTVSNQPGASREGINLPDPGEKARPESTTKPTIANAPGPVRDEDEPTHLEIPFERFLANVLSDDGDELAAVAKVARAIAASEKFLAGLKLYTSRWEEYASPELVETSLLVIFNEVRFAGPTFGLSLPYPHHIQFDTRSVHDRPHCFGARREDCDIGAPDWIDTLIIVDVVSPKRPLPAPKPRPAWGQMRWLDPIVDTVVDTQPSPAPAPLNHTPPDTKELTKMASKVIHYAGHRRHLLGVLIDGPDIFLFYFDRAGSIRSSRTRMVDNPVSVVTAILLLHLGTSKRLGFDASIMPPPHQSIATRLEKCLIDVEGHTFTIEGQVHRGQSLYGRGTAIYLAKPSPSSKQGHSPFPESVIVKTSWQITTRELEDELYKRAAAYGVQGISKLYCSRRGGVLSDGIRARLMPSSTFTDRELRIQVLGPVCMPLWRVADVDKFKTAFISLVQAHYDLYEKAGILHRDISIMNLMVDVSDISVGVLIDFDLAAIVKDDEGNPLPVMPMMTGTRAFLSLDQLQDAPIIQPYYRHDLESFLYVLAWILVHFDKGSGVSDDGLEMFHEGGWYDIKLSKLGFLTRPWDRTFAGDKALVDTWLSDLGHLFWNGYRARRESDGVNFDDRTLDGHVTFETFMHALKNPRPWPR